MKRIKFMVKRKSVSLLFCHTKYMPYRFANSLRAESGWVPSWSCSQAVSKPVWHIPLLCVQWITPDDGQRNCPKHVEFRFQNKFEKLVHLVGFIIRKFVTMHGHMNVKVNHFYMFRLLFIAVFRKLCCTLKDIHKINT